MFELLKKKLSGFADKLKQTVSAKPQATIEQKPATAIEKNLPVEEKPKTKIAAEIEELTKEEIEIEKELEKADKKIDVKEQAKEKKITEKKPEIVEETKKPVILEKPKQAVEEKKRELKAKLGLAEKVKSVFTGSVEIKESDVAGLLDELELSLLEADVEQETAIEICSLIKKELAGKKVSAASLNETIKAEIKRTLLEIMNVQKIDFFEKISGKKPFVILLLGPNGAGKTTSLAKLTFLLQSKGKSTVWAAADTFRAASIEQLETHAARLKTRVVKHKYGSDPAAVAFDAVKAAEAGKNDVVLIDSAGRQETNKNLMEELKKIVRVAKPDLKLFVGESLTGQALLQQATEFNEALGLDGFILTKIDCDTKGGTTISLLYKIKKPVLFVGTGQEYKDLQEFEPGFVINALV